MLQVLKDNEVLKMTVNDINDLDVINYLFPSSVIEIDAAGNNIIAIVRADTIIE